MDPGLFQALTGTVELFFLVFIRVTGMFIVSPIFGRQNLPVYYKVGFSFFVTLIMMSTAVIVAPITYGAAAGYAYFAVREFIIGAAIGFIPYLMFSVIYLAGQMIDMKIGFSMVNVLDPVNNIQIPITANFYYIICMLMFITVNAHHMVILTICRSYEIIPLGNLNMDGDLIRAIIRLFADIFSIGFRIAAPIIFTIFLADVALGIISKAMPQINVFMVGMPLKILVGIFVMIVTVPAMLMLLGELYKNIGAETVNIMRGIGRQ
jgi:flagellar biosynthetic protein FliR